MSRFLLALVCLLLLSPAVPARAAAPGAMSDSTTFQSWRLANGLEVRLRDVPGAGSIAITMAYRAGTAIEPAGQPGLADLLAQIYFTAPAGDIPERGIAEMSSLRPLGWKLSANAHVALFTEVASREQFAGVLRQVATRAHGVQVSDSSLRGAIAATRRQLGERYLGAPEGVLYERLRDLATGVDDAQALQRASGRGIENCTVAEAESLLRQLYVPANGVLSLAGDFASLPLRSIVEREFGGIAAGVAQPDSPSLRWVGGSRASLVNGLSLPVAGVAVAAPALEDSLHPTFALAMTIIGGWWSKQHDPRNPPYTSYFQYSLVDEPEIARFDFDVQPETNGTPELQESWNLYMETFSSQMFTGEMLNAVRQNVSWLLGGPLPSQLRRQARTSPPVLATIAGGMATRALWKGDAFWQRYLARFGEARLGPTSFRAWLESPANLSFLLLRPKS